MDVTADGGFLRFFADLPDPRGVNKVHKLLDMIVIAVMAVICGADGWSEVALFGRCKHQWLATFLELPNGIPSHDTFGRVFARLDPDAFERCFLAWMSTLVELSGGRLVAIDGKSIRRSFEHAWDKSSMAHMVSALVSQDGNRLVFGQVAVQDKSNEITAIPKLLELMDLKGAVVTIDAMGTQREVAQTILDGGGDYVLALKANWPATLKAVQALFDTPPRGGTRQTHQTIDTSHGRTETRRYRVCCELGEFFARPGTRDSPAFPGVAMVGMVQSHTERDGKIEQETRYYLCSTKLDAETFGRVVRGHWGIENGLHWVLDVVFRDDLARLRTDHGPANMAVVRHMAINLLRQATPSTSLKNRRKRAGWNTDYLAELIRQAA